MCAIVHHRTTCITNCSILKISNKFTSKNSKSIELLKLQPATLITTIFQMPMFEREKYEKNLQKLHSNIILSSVCRRNRTSIIPVNYITYSKRKSQHNTFLKSHCLKMPTKEERIRCPFNFGTNRKNFSHKTLTRSSHAKRENMFFNNARLIKRKKNKKSDHSKVEPKRMIITSCVCVLRTLSLYHSLSQKNKIITKSLRICLNKDNRGKMTKTAIQLERLDMRIIYDLLGYYRISCQQRRCV